MSPGSVIVDLAAEQGGNCELTEPEQVVGEARRHHHRLHRPAEPPAKQSSTLYATNLLRSHRGALQDQGRRHRRQHGRRGDPRHHRHQGRRSAAAAAAELSAAPRKAGPPRRTPAPPKHAHGTSGARRRPRHSPSCYVAAMFWLIGVRAARVPRPLHRVRAGLLRRLHGGLERDARAAHAADERDQRDQRHHRDRRAGAVAPLRRRTAPRPTG